MLMESVGAKLDTYLRTAVIVLMAITKIKKTGSANVRFKSKQIREGRIQYYSVTHAYIYIGMTSRENFCRAIYTYNVCILCSYCSAEVPV